MQKTLYTLALTALILSSCTPLKATSEIKPVFSVTTGQTLISEDDTGLLTVRYQYPECLAESGKLKDVVITHSSGGTTKESKTSLSDLLGGLFELILKIFL